MPRARTAAGLAAMLVILTAPSPGAAPDGVSSVPREIVLMEGSGRQLAFVAEKSTQQFHVYEWSGGRARLVETLPCTTGKVEGDKRVEGDLKTPEGAYRFLRYIDGRQLPPLYGAGAFVMDYPNPFDILARKTGGGIWMHGVETDARVHVARDTRGCVALANADIVRLRSQIRLHDTPIIVVESLRGVAPDEVARDAKGVHEFIEGWRSAWESRDIDAYIRLYSPSFFSEGRDLKAWERHKRQIAAQEGPRRIEIRDLTVLREKDRWWISFRQEYATSGHRDAGMKTLHLVGPAPPNLRIVSERWRGLDDGFRLIAADELPPVLTPALVASIAPDAAAPPTTRPPPAATATPTEVVPEPPAPTDVAAAAVAPSTPVGETSRVGDASNPTEPPPTEPEASPAAPRRLSARLETTRGDRGAFRLLGPHVQRQGEALLVQVQLMNLRATSPRSGALVVSLPTPEGLPPEPPRPEPFTVKQGRLIALSLPDADLPLRVGLLVMDDAGRVSLDQDLIVEAVP